MTMYLDDADFKKSMDDDIYGEPSYMIMSHDKRKRLSARRRIERLQEERMLREQLDDYYDDRWLS